MSKNNLIICTGFDVFKDFKKKNASWEAVNLLPDELKFKSDVFEIKKIKIPVEYKAVDKAVDEIWNQFPALVIHCGVSGKARAITLESCAINQPYCKMDYSNQCLNSDKVDLKFNGKNTNLLQTNIDIHKIAKELNNEDVVTNENCDCSNYICSTDVGNYLCGYIYLKSLDINEDRSLFIHVPDINKPFSSEQTKEGILKVIVKCLEDLSNKNLL